MILKIALENSEGGQWFAILLSSDREIDDIEHQRTEAFHNTEDKSQEEEK